MSGWGDGSRWKIRRLTNLHGRYRFWVLPPNYLVRPVVGFDTFEEARAAFAQGGGA